MGTTGSLLCQIPNLNFFSLLLKAPLRRWPFGVALSELAVWKVFVGVAGGKLVQL